MGDDLQARLEEGRRKLAAAEGAKRSRAEADLFARDERARAHMRLAIGRWRLRHVRKAVLATTMLSSVLLCAGIAGASFDVLSGVAEVVLPIGVCGLVLSTWIGSADAPWRATLGMVRAEQRWVDELPFALEGYLEALGRYHGGVAHLRIAIVLSPDAPHVDRDTLRALIATVADELLPDRGDRIDVRVQSPDKDGAAVVAFAHALVDRVLLPLHARHPLVSVRLETS